MKNTFKSLTNLNNLKDGFNKIWIYPSKVDRDLSFDFLQKINFAIQAFNEIASRGLPLDNRKNIIYLIALVDWISDGVAMCRGCLMLSLLKRFHFTQEDEFRKARDYFLAI